LPLEIYRYISPPTFQNSDDEQAKFDILKDLLAQESVSESSTDAIQHGYHKQSKKIQSLIIQVLMRNDYETSVFYLSALFEEDLNEAVRLIDHYAMERKSDWWLLLKIRLGEIDQGDIFGLATQILRTDPNFDFEVLRPFVSHKNPEIRSQTFHALSFLNNKMDYEQEFLVGLADSSEEVIITVLQALKGFKTKAILDKLQELSYRFPHIAIEEHSGIKL